MDQLSLPSFDVKLKRFEGNDMIYDIVRKKYVALAPEEWVRQHFVNYLISHLGFPRALISVEQGLRYNTLLKRSDIIVFSRKGKPILLVECKATEHKLNQKVMEQALMYNKTIKAAYIVVTNGLESACMYVDKKNSKVDFLEHIPQYEELIY